MLSEISSILEVGELSIRNSLSGCSHEIFVLESADGQRWTLRIAENEFASSLASKSVAVMRHIKTLQPTIQIPAIFHTVETYSVLEYMQGAPIGSCDWHLMGEKKRHELLDGIAAFLVQLWTCPVPAAEQGENRSTDTLLSLMRHVGVAEITYRDWLLDEVGEAICRSIENPGWGSPIPYLQRRAEVDELDPCQENLGMIFKHGDMNEQNVLVNSDELSG
jgi:aminoglycoside phosphotransferase (APT) family kinase protein